MINWSPSLRSGISDIEVDHVRLSCKTDIEVPGYKKKITFGQMLDIAYELKDSDEKITVSTTRPETIYGDAAIAVNPNDMLYSRYIGCFVKHPFKHIFLPVIADESVSVELGTGAMKVTPAHDPVDYLIAKKHNLEIINVIDEDGKMTEHAGKFQGLPRYIARDKIILELSEKGLLKSIRDHEMVVPICSRTGDIIEYMLKEQWFLKCKSMAQLAVKAVQDKSLKIDPPLYEEAWFSWLEDTKDWCLSRQLIWGHRIPAYRCDYGNKSTWLVASSENEALKLAKEKYGSNIKIEQDNDVLDTWFSSAILPFSVMGWPDQTENFKKFYPLSLLVTGKDILFFWTARMTMLGLELTEKLPFKELFLHGVLCDAQGKKMSKSSGNVISPENVINGISLKDLNNQSQESYDSGILSSKELKRTFSVNTQTYPNGISDCGADALRFTLASLNVKNPTNSFSVDQCKANKHFCNKILQACRYTLGMTDENYAAIPTDLSTLDYWILSKLACMVKNVNVAMNDKSLHKASSAIKQFIYYEFCDLYIEGTKLGFRSGERSLTLAHRFALITCLEVSLRILAPFMPFLSDELYTKLSRKFSNFSSYPSLMEASYPTFKELQEHEKLDLEEQMDIVIDTILKIRSLLNDVNKKLDFEVHIVADSIKEYDIHSKNINVIKAVSKIAYVEVLSSTNYVEMKNSFCDKTRPNCFVYLIVKDDAVYEELKHKLEKRKKSLKKKCYR